MKKILLTIILVIIIISSVFLITNENVIKNTSTDVDKNYNFTFVCSLPENEYWLSCIEGMRTAENELGVKIKVVGPKNPEKFATKILDYMKDAIEEKPDGIIAYAGIKEMTPLIEDAKNKGIPVITIDSDAPESSRVAYVGTDGYNAGYEAGKKMNTFIKENSQIAIYVSSKSAEKEMQVIEAFREAIHDYNIEVVAFEETDVEIEMAEAKAKEILKKYPNLKAIFSTGNGVTGAARVKEALKLNNLVLMGFDDTKENIEYVNNGIIDSLIVQNIKEVGYQSIYLMNKYLENGALPKAKYDSGIAFVTKDNVNTYNLDISEINSQTKKVKVGYYTGNLEFQDGFDENSRKSGYAYEYYQVIADIVGWDYEYIYGSRTQMVELLEEGKVDIIAGIFKTETTQNKMLFSEYDMGLIGTKQYFAVNKERIDLLNELNYAMNQLVQSNPNYTATLLQKYYTTEGSQILNDIEKNWIEENKKIKVGYVKYNLPLSDQDDKGNPIGIVKELFGLIENYSSLKIEPVCFEKISDMEAALTNKEIDSAFPIYSDQWTNEAKGFRQTDSFFSDRVMVVYNGNYTQDILNKVALSRTGIGQAYYLNTYYPDSEITFYNSRKEVFAAIESEKEKCMIGCSSILQRFLLDNVEYNNLNIAYLETSEDFGMAVRQSDSILINILNKSIRQIDEAKITSIILKYSDLSNTFTLKKFIQRYFLAFVIITSLFIISIVSVFMLYIKNTIKYKREQIKTNKALEKAVKSANSANEAKTNFLSSISHDIRTPMNAIVGMTSIANKYIDDKERVADCLKKIDLSSRHLLTLINNVLDISKIESGNLQLNPVDFSIRETIDTMLDIVNSELTSKKLKFDVDINSLKYESLYADEVRINQIFMNILTNAVKYTPNGGKINMSLSEELLDDDKTVRITYIVKDTGIGMSEEYMKNMYNTFSRAEDSRINRIQGTGLGLAIVKQMVDMMNGTINCESKENVGTKFTVILDLPISKIEINTKLINSKESSISFDEIHLLIAEDNDLNWEIISELLNIHGITAERAENGQVCIDKLKAAKPGTYNLILMDVQMPIMNGRETSRTIRKDEDDYIRNIPIIGMTADAFAEDIAAGLESGMNGYVVKPIDMDKLFQEIRKVLDNTGKK